MLATTVITSINTSIMILALLLLLLLLTTRQRVISFKTGKLLVFFCREKGLGILDCWEIGESSGEKAFQQKAFRYSSLAGSHFTHAAANRNFNVAVCTCQPQNAKARSKRRQTPNKTTPEKEPAIVGN